ncbi:MAG: preprotein translocase subunit SecA [Clostridia bacterium]|nr:preprotein translocase subunit SecA [Clostridia bacterium]
MGLFNFLANFDNNRSLKKLNKIALKVEALEEKYSKMSDDDLKAQTDILKDRLKNGETLDDILPDAYAVVREAAFRVLKMKHFHVQIIGGIVLHQGRIAEMKTGEGKTLVSTLPAYLNALSGKPVHIVTVNEYLAKRDAEWMGKIHRFLGLKVGVVYANQPLAEKKNAYLADITYGTNSEFGFDYLRDNMAQSREEMMMRGLEFAIVDEVDSILIDEARTPLILSGPSGDSSEEYEVACRFAKSLKASDVDIDEKKKTIHLTESGVSKAEKFYHLDNLSDMDNLEVNHNINNAIRARFMMKRDNDYIVHDGEVLIVDEFTGRIMVGRRYSDGLHQAIEAKEGVKINAENKTLATVTLQNFFKMYTKISGMTGTAKTEEAEFRDIYGLDVVTIPTNTPVKRIDANDSFYFSHDAKIRAICKDIQDCFERQQPVLVGTITVEKSEELSKALRKMKIPHNVLNAKNHQKEAEIIAQAGRLGSVTIATNMAGRGTDIMLGGNSEFKAKEAMKKQGFDEELIELASSYFPVNTEEEQNAREVYQNLKKEFDKEVKEEKQKVIELGGLKIIGTERHESRRIDNQLRGRSGRQGDPGYSIFYISADDDLARVFGSERLKKMASFLKLDEDTSINWKFFSRSVATAQKRVEGHNFSIRKQVVEYDNVLNRQREEVYRERNRIIDGEDVHEKILQMIREVVGQTVYEYDNDKQPEEVDQDAFNAELERRMLEPGTNFITTETLTKYSSRELAEEIYALAVERYENKKKETEEQGADFSKVERHFLLSIMDRKWIDHIDDMDILRQGVGLRAYGNKNPITVYQQEGYDMFDDMITAMRRDVANVLMSVKIQVGPRPAPLLKRNVPKPNATAPQGTVVNKGKQIGRNDPCPCGSGKKYKNCCGKV